MPPLTAWAILALRAAGRAPGAAAEYVRAAPAGGRDERPSAPSALGDAQLLAPAGGAAPPGRTDRPARELHGLERARPARRRPPGGPSHRPLPPPQQRKAAAGPGIHAAPRTRTTRRSCCRRCGRRACGAAPTSPGARVPPQPAGRGRRLQARAGARARCAVHRVGDPGLRSRPASSPAGRRIATSPASPAGRELSLLEPLRVTPYG